MRATSESNHDCETFLEQCFEEFEFAESFTTPKDLACEDCREALDTFREDSERLRAHFAKLTVPPVPVLPFREAMRAASGHPRRVSTNLLPILWLVVFLVLLGIVVAVGQLMKSAIENS